jgi:mono/diheme cytochrome c family protein
MCINPRFRRYAMRRSGAAETSPPPFAIRSGRRALMKKATSLGALLGIATLSLLPGILRAQELPGDPVAGRALTVHWCSDCHNAKSTPDDPGLAADFTSIARQPSTTALSLRVFLQSNHDRMPDFELKTTEADDIIAYIVSLKGK